MSDVLTEHLSYVSDERRLALYRQAVGAALSPGDVAVDLGCGTAILGLLCLQAGASRVYGIDESGALEIARETLHRADLSGRAHLIEGTTFHVALPEPADLLICDHVGYFGIDYGLVDLMADARKRFLKPGGQLIPGRLRLFVGAVQSQPSHDRATAWAADKVPEPLRWVKQLGENNRHGLDLTADEIISEPVQLCEIDLREDHPALFSWQVELEMAHDGLLHGLAGWFECELAEGVWMTNSPLSDQAISRHQAFFPTGEAMEVRQGQRWQLQLMTRPSDSLITWELRHPPTGRSIRRSSWEGDVLSAARLRKAHPAHIPAYTPYAKSLTTVLSYVNGERCVAEIQALVEQHHPDLFPSPEETRRFVSKVLGGYTQ